jgi:Mce-associated membrane protein
METDVTDDLAQTGSIETGGTETDAETGGTETDRTETEPQRRTPLIVAGIVLIALATAAAAVFGVLWLTVSRGHASAISQDRDNALRAAEQGSINLTTLDYRNVAQGLDRWKQSTTGDLLNQLTQGNLVSTFTKQAQQAKSVTTGKVLDGVITELAGDKAQAIVYMQVTVSAAGSKPTTKYVPLQWNLTNTKSGWKLSSLPTASSGN